MNFNEKDIFNFSELDSNAYANLASNTKTTLMRINMKKIQNKQYGRSLLKTVLLIPILLIGSVVAYFFFCEARKAYWDHQVEVMCEKDGGAVIFEEIILNDQQKREMIDGFGNLSIPDEKKASTAPVFSSSRRTYLYKGNLSVVRSEFKIVRRADGKILSKQVIYSRIGGDFPSYGHHSSFSCVDMNMKNKKFQVEKMTVIS